MEANIEKKIEEKKTQLKPYFITLIVLASIYLMLTALQFFWAKSHNKTILMSLFVTMVLIASTVLLIIALLDCSFINKHRPEEGYRVQIIILSTILAAIGFSLFFGILLVILMMVFNYNIHSTGLAMQIVSFILTTGINIAIIVFYSLSLKKLLKK